MIHPLIEASEFSGSNLDALSGSNLDALNAAFERICCELQLATRPDPLTDIVAAPPLQLRA
jgi:hypothetical protein